MMFQHATVTFLAPSILSHYNVICDYHIFPNKFKQQSLWRFQMKCVSIDSFFVKCGVIVFRLF